MKNFKFLGVVAFAFLLSLNAGVLLDGNNWDSTTEVAEAQIAPGSPTALITPVPVVVNNRKRLGWPCWVNGGPGIKITCAPLLWFSCTPSPCS